MAPTSVAKFIALSISFQKRPTLLLAQRPPQCNLNCQINFAPVNFTSLPFAQILILARSAKSSMEDHFVTAAEIKLRLKERIKALKPVNELSELLRLSYMAILPKRIPLLTKSSKENHSQWALEHRRCNWWHKVVFSDKTTFQMFRNTCLA
ncbi:hypothetical protein G9A89_016933 [Geosiphon pyriformis]|nr:hypothetical protein G9A89_016933 [Geosiphon pyriformis]